MLPLSLFLPSILSSCRFPAGPAVADRRRGWPPTRVFPYVISGTSPSGARVTRLPAPRMAGPAARPVSFSGTAGRFGERQYSADTLLASHTPYVVATAAGRSHHPGERAMSRPGGFARQFSPHRGLS